MSVSHDVACLTLPGVTHRLPAALKDPSDSVDNVSSTNQHVGRKRTRERRTTKNTSLATLIHNSCEIYVVVCFFGQCVCVHMYILYIYITLPVGSLSLLQ